MCHDFDVNVNTHSNGVLLNCGVRCAGWLNCGVREVEKIVGCGVTNLRVRGWLICRVTKLRGAGGWKKSRVREVEKIVWCGRLKFVVLSFKLNKNSRLLVLICFLNDENPKFHSNVMIKSKDNAPGTTPMPNLLRNQISYTFTYIDFLMFSIVFKWQSIMKILLKNHKTQKWISYNC